MPAVTHAVTYTFTPVALAWVNPSSHTVVSATSAPIAFRSLSGCGTSVPVTDDTISDPIPLGFNFQFAGVVVDRVRIVSNGRLQFLNQNPANGTVFDNATCGFGTPDQFPLPNASIPYTMKVYGADIDPTNIENAPAYGTRCSLTGAGAGPFGTLPCFVSFATIGSLPNRQFVVTWNNVPEWTSGSLPQGNFQLQVLVGEDGTFTYQYGQNNSVSVAQIGWQADPSVNDFAVPNIGPLPPQNLAVKFYIPGPASVTATGGTPQSTGISTAFANPLQVTVKDLGNNPVAGVTVNFVVPGGGASAALSAASAVTNGSGVASVTATANATAGSYSVTASVAGVATPATFSLTNTAGTAASVTATGGTPQSTGISTAFANPLQVTVKDLGNNPVAGVTVNFVVPGSGASAALSAASAVTNGSGVASVTATANATAGSYSVTASVAGVTTPATFSLTNTAGTAASVTATGGTPQSTGISTAFANPLQVTVKDLGNNPVAGVTVNFVVPGGGASAALSAASAVTNGSGVASVTATANATAGSYSVTASVAGVATPATFSLTNTAGTAASVTATGGTPQSTGISTAFANPLQVTVKDLGNNPVAGVTVNFVVPGSGASAALSAASAVTNGSGVASVTATANATAGSYSVTASVAGVATPATFSLTNTAGTAASVTATGGTPQSTGISTVFANPLQVTVKDLGGNPVAGVTVNFAVPGSGASAALSAASAVTNGSGVASVTATANATAGSYSVTASVAGVATPATFSLTNTAGTAASVTATGGTPQSTGISTVFANPLQVTVKDLGGNPVAGVTVNFAVPGSGASAALSAASAVTNGSGVASVTATANATAGSYSVTASVAGVATPATFSLTNTAGTAASVTATGGTPQSTGISTVFANPLQVTVKDLGSNPVAGVTVNFAVPGSGASAALSAASAVTNGSGVASVTATANATAGSYSVTASVAGVATPATFSLTNTAGTAASVSVPTLSTWGLLALPLLILLLSCYADCSTRNRQRSCHEKVPPGNITL